MLKAHEKSIRRATVNTFGQLSGFHCVLSLLHSSALIRSLACVCLTRLHCQSDWPSRCAGNAAEQPQSARAPESRLHHGKIDEGILSNALCVVCGSLLPVLCHAMPGRDRDCRRNLLALHCAARPHERIPRGESLSHANRLLAAHR